MSVTDVLREELEQQFLEASRDADSKVDPTKVDPTKDLRSIRLDLAEQMQGRPKGN
ncbi:hypothetical protein [Cutibacterium avidum]|uniref:hypothetical protein n=1 Tax=Cutibacterium avidum TaxID=33010 RepID=UPI00192B6BE8|nr:hypothetical protein [Cutibacterium avidum]QQY14707.1 hypothetical protein JMX53_10680 [Cutibacterium avidum]BCQ03080.1 hypothetical protein TPCV4_15240 [Cutibacterium avidum]